MIWIERINSGMLSWDCRIFFSVWTQKTRKELAFVPSECLFVSCERAPRSKQASEPLRGIMDDAVDSLRENDSYGSLARFVEVDRQRLRISELEARFRGLDTTINLHQISRLRITLRDDVRADPPLITCVVAIVDDAFILMYC